MSALLLISDFYLIQRNIHIEKYKYEFIHSFISSLQTVGLFILQILRRFIQLDRKQQQQPQINSCVEYLPYFLRDYMYQYQYTFVSKNCLPVAAIDFTICLLSEYLRRECKTKGAGIQVRRVFSFVEIYVHTSFTIIYVCIYILGGKLGVSISDAALFKSFETLSRLLSTTTTQN